MITNTVLKIGILLLIVPAFLALIACTKANTSTAVTPPADTTTTANAKSFLALGDSYTIGQNVSAAERFPAQTVALLSQMNVAVKEPVYIAQTGWTTSNLSNAINAANPSSNYDIVTLLIGVNDQYQRVDTAGYRVRFTELLNKAIQLAAGRTTRVFVVSIPDYSVTPFVPASDKARVSMEIDWFNNINRQVTEQRKIAYINITPGSREGATNPALIANDGLHPSGSEYRKWANMLAPVIKQALQ